MGPNVIQLNGEYKPRELQHAVLHVKIFPKYYRSKEDRYQWSREGKVRDKDRNGLLEELN